MFGSFAKIGYLASFGSATAVAVGVATGVLPVDKIRTMLNASPAVESSVRAAAPSKPEEANEPTRLASLPQEAAPKTNVEAPSSAEPAIVADVLPVFDVLRVEKDGSVLVAGSTMPNRPIELVAEDGTVIGKAVAGPGGDFVILSDAPLAAGNYVLSLRSLVDDTNSNVSAQTAIVSVPEKGGDVLAMISTEGEASRIVTKPEALEKPVEVAKQEEEPKSVEVAKVESKEAPVSSAEEKPADGAEVAKLDNEPQPKPQPDAKPVDSQPEPAKQQVAAVEPASPVEKADPAAAVTVPVQPTVQTPTDNAEAPAVATPSEPEAAVASLEKEPADTGQSPAPVESAVQVIVEAVEVEGRNIFIAGAVPNGEIVRVYIDNQPVGDARGTADNRFLITTPFDLASGEHVVRADVIDNKTGEVVARAEVPLLHEVPVEQKAIAKAPEPKPVPSAESSVEVTTKAAPEVPVPTLQQEVQPEAAVTTAVAALKQPEVATDTPTVVEPEKEVKAPQAAAPAAKAISEPVPTPSQVSTPAPDPVIEAAFDSGQSGVIRTGRAIIIKPGDNLWRISRDTYGRGIRYTTIYNANRDQIRDPSRIYIGQIFKIPETAVE